MNYEVKIDLDNVNFDDIRKNQNSRGAYEFFGLPMLQIPEALLAINSLLEIIKPNKIIEFGTGSGGLSVLLSLYASINRIQFFTFDAVINRQDIVNHIYGDSSFNWIDDLKEKKTQEKITKLIKQLEGGPNLIFCDALKDYEFNFYAEHLKHGDCILIHDYAKNQNDPYYQTVKEKYGWSSPQEFFFDKIKDSCQKYNIIPFLPKELEKYLWFCAIKQN